MHVTYMADEMEKAFPCISTGIYGFPNEPAAEIALETVKTWIKKNGNEGVQPLSVCCFQVYSARWLRNHHEKVRWTREPAWRRTKRD
ncbi:O-acetyl-ADP-ribose deacetylase MACROD2-like isoform X1 [Arapaima gigas]